VIVSEFDGDTVAFYETVRPQKPKADLDLPEPIMSSDLAEKIAAWD